MNSKPADLLTELMNNPPAAYALLYRPHVDPGVVELHVGEPHVVDTTTSAFPADGPALLLFPYRQITERGFTCHDDGERILALRITRTLLLPLAAVLAFESGGEVTCADGAFFPADDEYAECVRRVIHSEIGSGEGSNFVVKRSWKAHVAGWSEAVKLTILRRLLAQESGTYWTFLVSFAGRTLVGASPEGHVKVDGRTVTMNPISGSLSHPEGPPDVDDMLRFLGDRKESDELYMVLDEELKMMARICDNGGSVTGPQLKEMTHLAHTEYHISGESSLPLSEIMRETMFAPTVTGSPVENACRVIQRHESMPRGFYSGAIALVEGERKLDSAILIRTADINSDGYLTLGVGATLVRHSDPDNEVAETHAKVAGLLSALGPRTSAVSETRPMTVGPRLAEHPRVAAALAARNRHLARFWLERARPQPHTGWKTLVVDAEDTFTDMLAHQLRHLGHEVVVRGYQDVDRVDGWDLVVIGPGPGDPRDDADPKIAKLRRFVAELHRARSPFLAVCLGHQVLSRHLGLVVSRLDTPSQGRQATIDLFGERATVGFYNTFVARSEKDTHGEVTVSRDPATHEVFAMRGEFFRSFQFHPESILSADGVDILSGQLSSLLAVRR